MTGPSKWQALPTEAVNSSTAHLDTLPIEEIVELMMLDNRRVVDAVQQEKPNIQRAIALLVDALNKRGRLIFVGAGTSGRLGVLEAAEMPPTFGISHDVVHAIMAGGTDAVHRAKEGVEDDEQEGAHAVARLRPTKRDVVIGVSASGVTPFVRGALTRAPYGGPGGVAAARLVLVGM